MASVSINANLNLNQQSVNSAAKQVQSTFNNVNINPRSLNNFSNSLGRITGQASEFQKSMDAATARVFAFGATAAVIQSISQSFKALVSVTIEVEKRLTEISAIFGTTEKQFSKFRDSIFQVAKNTGQSFNVVADGAAELARQGLSAEETAKRLNAALILTRVSGLDSVSSVNALTAAINGFTSASLDATTIVNKLVAVDTAFAVSAKDLADAFQRAGSTAEDAGVSFDELLGIVTAVQQTTSRGGAVIGNALKSIFTRISRSSTISELQALGVQINENQTGIQKLQALSEALERVSNPSTASQIKELAGGVFQINVVSAALKDLSNEASIFEQASQTAAGASNQALEKNAQLNQTLAAQINSLVAGLTNLGEKIGQLTFAPLISDLVQIAEKITSFLSDALSEENGNFFIKSFFKGIGIFLRGPGLILITTAFLNIFKLVAKFAKEGFSQLTQLSNGSQKIKEIEQGIIQLLSQDKTLRSQLASATLTQAQKEQLVIDAIKRENQLLLQQKAILESLARTAAAAGVGGFGAGVGFKGKKGKGTFTAGGFVPSFAEEMMERSMASDAGYKAGNVKKRRMFDGAGGSFVGVYNDAETVTDVSVGGNKGTFVIPPTGFAAGGYVPNFTKFTNKDLINRRKSDFFKSDGSFKSKKNEEKFNNSTDDVKAKFNALRGVGVAKDPKDVITIDGSDLGIVGLFRKSKSAPERIEGSLKLSEYKGVNRAKLAKTRLNDTVKLKGIQARSLDELDDEDFKEPASVSKLLDKYFTDGIGKFSEKIASALKISRANYNYPEEITKVLRTTGPSDLLTSGVQGQLFEASARIAASGAQNAISKFESQGAEQRPFDFEENSNALTGLQEAFRFKTPLLKADAKRTINRETASSIVKKALNDSSTSRKFQKLFIKSKASGYIPNFAGLGLNDAIDRELDGTGISKSQVRIGQDKAFAGNRNPLGLAVTNTRDEPNGISDVLAGFGYVPNFRRLPKIPKIPKKEKKEGGGIGAGQARGGEGKLAAATNISFLGSQLLGFIDGGEGLTEALKSATKELENLRKTVGENSDEFKEQERVVKEASKEREEAVLGRLGSGALTGATIGGSIGSVIPGLGNVVGGVVGGAVGTLSAARDENLTIGKKVEDNLREALQQSDGFLTTQEKAKIILSSQGEAISEGFKSIGEEGISFSQRLSRTVGALYNVSGIGLLEGAFRSIKALVTEPEEEIPEDAFVDKSVIIPKPGSEQRSFILNFDKFTLKDDIQAFIDDIFNEFDLEPAKNLKEKIDQRKKTLQRVVQENEGTRQLTSSIDPILENLKGDIMESQDLDRRGLFVNFNRDFENILKNNTASFDNLLKNFNETNLNTLLRQIASDKEKIRADLTALGVQGDQLDEFLNKWEESQYKDVENMSKILKQNREEIRQANDAFLKGFKDSFPDNLKKLDRNNEQFGQNVETGASSFVFGSNAEINDFLTSLNIDQGTAGAVLTSESLEEALSIATQASGTDRVAKILSGDLDSKLDRVVDPLKQFTKGEQGFFSRDLKGLLERSRGVSEGLTGLKTKRGGITLEPFESGIQKQLDKALSGPITSGQDIAQRQVALDKIAQDILNTVDFTTVEGQREGTEALTTISLLKDQLATSLEAFAGLGERSEELNELKTQTGILERIASGTDISLKERITDVSDAVKKKEGETDIEFTTRLQELMTRLSEEIRALKDNARDKDSEGGISTTEREAEIIQRSASNFDAVVIALKQAATNLAGATASPK